MNRQGCLLFVSAMISLSFLSGCASGRKQKLEQREKLAMSSGLYCDFINGEKNQEVELELNLVMSKRCDSDRPFTITNYKTPAEVTGVLYCCAIKKPEAFKANEAVKSEMMRTEVKEAPVEAKKAEVKPAAPAKPATPAKGQPAVDKKAAQPQDNKSNDKNALEEEIPL